MSVRLLHPFAALCALSLPLHGAGCAPRPVLPHASAPIGIADGDVEFAPAPPNLPAGVELAVLEGDPKRAAVFTLRLRLPAGFALIPHTHGSDERVTVLRGEVQVGFGEDVSAPTRSYRAGSFYVNPPGFTHFVRSAGGAEIQITALGPWRTDFVSQSEPK
jgi:quercetin dioxygenase-like cupin family protein